MSQINLDDLASDHPELREPLRKLERWLSDHRDPIIVPSRLARQLSGVDPYSLAILLMMMADAGILTRVYKVSTPSGVFADDEFTDVRKIPERLPDRFNNYFETADADVTPVFKRGRG